MTIVLNGTTGITNDGGYTGDGIVFADTTPANTLVTTTGGNVGIGNTAANVNDQVGAVRPLLVSRSDTSTTIAGSQANIVIGNADTTTSNTSQISFAALTGANSTYFTSAAINCVFGARTNGQYPTGQLVFSTSTSLNSAPTEKMRIDSSGNVGIGTSTIGSTGVSLNAGYNLGWVQSAGESIPNIFRQTSSAATVVANGYRLSSTSNGFASSFSSSYAKCAISCGTVAGAITFYTDTAAAVAAGTDVTPTERMRIDTSGNLLVGTTSSGASSNGFSLVASSDSVLRIGHASGTGTGSQYIQFNYNSSQIGSITQNGTTGVSYNTSSDYRLKHDIAPMTGALAKVAALKPCTYKWKVDGSDGEGFIAHELAEVCPQAVTGEKDAVDADGNPQYQGIDTSFLVATLTAAIQEQQAIITALTARVTALEGQP